MTPEQRANFYNTKWPDRPPLNGGKMLTGVWMIGSCYKNPNPLYGAYPHSYLERVHSMFPDVRSVLHVFSGGLSVEHAREYAGTADVELVDLMGPEQGRHPTWQGDVCSMPSEWDGRFDLVLADPPYSTEDAAVYGTKMVNRGKVTTALRRVCKPGGTLVWLDTVWPMHRKVEWLLWGTIGLVRSTNHRVRLISMFKAV